MLRSQARRPPPAPPVPSIAEYVNAYASDEGLVTFQRIAGRLVRRVQRPHYKCFLRASDISAELDRSIRKHPAVADYRPDQLEQGGWVAIRWTNRFVRDRYCEQLEKLGATPFEGHVDPVQRWVVDTGIRIARPERVYLDIETDSRMTFVDRRRARILCWSLVSGDGETKKIGMLEDETDEAERDLLERLWNELAYRDQIIAWNGDRFDFPVIRERTVKLRLRPEFERYLWLDHMLLFRKMNMHAAESGDEKQSLALDRVAQKILGFGKHDVDAAQAYEMWAAGGEVRRKLGEYCLNDADLMRLIEERTGYIELLQTLCDVTGVFPDTRGIKPTRQVETFLLRLGRERGVRARTLPPRFNKSNDEEENQFAKQAKEDKQEQFKGAFVLHPKRKGILRGVHVADFSRLYPSIITSWNMSPETFRESVVLKENPAMRPSYLMHAPLREMPLPNGCCVAPLTDRVFDNAPVGILAEAVSEMLRLRKAWDDKKSALPPGTPEWQEADRRSSAYKISANMFFGVVGSSASCFFVKEVAEAITQAGAWLIEQTIKACEERGWVVDYGDTDSVFVTGCTREQFAAFVDECNSTLYSRLLREKGCARCDIKIAYEKAFDRIFFVTAKRYAGNYLHYKGKAATSDSRPEIKGLEYKRGDTTRLARRMQEEVVFKLLGYKCEPCDDPKVLEEIVLDYRERVLNGALESEDFVLSKRLSKPLGGYVRKQKKDGSWAAQPPHIEVARVLKARGRDCGKGARIEYIVVDGEAKPIKCVPLEDYNDSEGPNAPDRFYLWEDLVYPPTQRVLESAIPEHNWSLLGMVRPPKPPRRRRSDALPGQLDLFNKADDLPAPWEMNDPSAA